VAGGMDFSVSAEQRELAEGATEFARRELNQDLAKLEDAGEFPREAWRKCAGFGVQGLPVPAELGGLARRSSRRPWLWKPSDTDVTTTDSSSRSTRRCGASSCR
jgi:alkylation response protein AidB-like acyl-CoA dehydrogenase